MCTPRCLARGGGAVASAVCLADGITHKETKPKCIWEMLACSPVYPSYFNKFVFSEQQN